MDAKQASKITATARAQQNDSINAVWNQVEGLIFSKIEAAAKQGKSEVVIDLKHNTLLILKGEAVKRVQMELESRGFLVSVITERCLNGARQMQVSW